MTSDRLDQSSVQSLKGVGPSLAAKLAKLGINTVQDVLFHLPARYLDRTRITPIGAVQPGLDVVLEAVVKVADVSFGRRRSLACRIQDGTGTLTLRFYHFSGAQKANLQAGKRIRCYGEVRRGSSGYEIYHPEYQLLDEDQELAVEESLTAIYPSTEGISQQGWRKLCSEALKQLKPGSLPEWLAPEDTTISLEDAIRYLHHPPMGSDQSLLQAGTHPIQQRLAIEELVAHNLILLRGRQCTQQLGAPPLNGPADLQQQFLAQLPFTLTGAQQHVAEEIELDLAQKFPMLRLVQGDVGSGKTVVAALAALRAVASGYQVAIMSPTEILAEQHYQNFQAWLTPLGLYVSWLSGKVKGKQRQQQLSDIAEHRGHVVVGTHALFQDEVVFGKLGLVIIDEQHRFGVHQRLALKEKAKATTGHPHQLIMTATPIPRTLAMSAYADLDTSIIDELPPGRTPVNTAVIDNTRRVQVIERVQIACQAGRQVYWVCTLIEESESLSAKAAEDTYQSLTEALPNVRVGLVHGRMKATEKAAVMAQYKAHKIDLLVATTVIEVGVDVPNASLMIIDNAERLGLAQLHQLRGRVGRGSTASHCLLMYQAPLSQLGKERLRAMRESSDGFIIAEKDLEIRGPGELLGTRQTGLVEMRVAELARDGHLLDRVQLAAEHLLNNHPEAVQPLIERWLANAEQYTQV